MTFRELKNEIYNLNWESFDDFKSEPSQLPQAINRAMSIITTEVHPLLASIEISRRALKNIVSKPISVGKAVIYAGEAPLSFTAEGKAVSFCFECDGEGTAVLSDENTQLSIPLTSSRIYRRYCGFCGSNPCLTFKGEFSYNIKNVAFYNQKLSDDPLDIPMPEGFVEYDIKRLTQKSGKPRFSALEACLYWQDGVGASESGGEYKACLDYRVEGQSILLLPPMQAATATATAQGEEQRFKIIYRCGFEPVTEKTEDSRVIELDDEASMLLPLLASYFFWLDDERSRAQEYYNQYEMRRDAILYNKSRPHAVCGVSVKSRFGGLL